MVTKVLRQVVTAVAADLTAFTRVIRLAWRGGKLRPGLYAYRLGAGADRRQLHLQVHSDASAVLFVDVSHAIKLNPTAAIVAWSLLEGVTPKRLAALMTDWHPTAPSGQIAAEVGQTAALLDLLRQPGRPCPVSHPYLSQTTANYSQVKAPYKVDLALTYACNNRCGHCYNPLGRSATPILTLKEWKSVIRRLSRLGIPHLIFTGGEPTTFEPLPTLVRHANRLGHVTGVNTNGRRLSDRRYATKLLRSGLDHIQITLASHQEELHNAIVQADAFQETVEGIRNCIGLGLHTITNTTITHQNCDEVSEIIAFLYTLGVSTFAMNSMICSGRGCSNPEALSEAELLPVLQGVQTEAERLGMRFLWYTPTEYCELSPVELGLGPKSCNAAEYSICVEPNGDVLPCQSYYEPAGNILRDDWASIWESPLFKRLRLRRENPRVAGLDERCYDCPELPLCGGGCPLRREERRKEALAYA